MITFQIWSAQDSVENQQERFGHSRKEKYFKWITVQSNPALRTPASYGELIIADSLPCPWEKKALT